MIFLTKEGLSNQTCRTSRWKAEARKVRKITCIIIWFVWGKVNDRSGKANHRLAAIARVEWRCRKTGRSLTRILKTGLQSCELLGSEGGRHCGILCSLQSLTKRSHTWVTYSCSRHTTIIFQLTSCYAVTSRLTTTHESIGILWPAMTWPSWTILNVPDAIGYILNVSLNTCRCKSEQNCYKC